VAEVTLQHVLNGNMSTEYYGHTIYTCSVDSFMNYYRRDLILMHQ